MADGIVSLSNTLEVKVYTYTLCVPRRMLLWLTIQWDRSAPALAHLQWTSEQDISILGE